MLYLTTFGSAPDAEEVKKEELSVVERVLQNNPILRPPPWEFFSYHDIFFLQHSSMEARCISSKLIPFGAAAVINQKMESRSFMCARLLALL